MTMMMLRSAALLAALAPAFAWAVTPIEPPSIAQDVAAGRMKPVAERIPAEPKIVTPDRPDIVPGKHGGEMRMVMGRAQDVRMMVVYGYARLIAYNAKLELEPDILLKVDNDGDRIFTLHLRPGHRWSDGHPFTSDDFRYYWEDVANQRNISPSGPPRTLLVNDKPPKVEFPDAHTVRYSWDAPNPFFLPSLAGPSPLYIFRPAHYLKAYHQKYAEAAALAEHVRKANARNWSQLHNRLDNQYRNDNPDLPSLEPWVIQTRPPAERFVFVRNPYYHRLDVDGRQLPYVDRVVMTIADGRLIPAKTGGGEADLQARNLAFNNYTFLRQAQKRNEFTVNLWNTVKGSHLALYPNLNVNDPVYRSLLRDVRFRRALSLAINRREINQVAYFGLAIESANTVITGSPLFKPEYRDAYATFNLAEANRLLDQIGLTKRDGRGVRLMEDGRPLEIIVETAGEDTEQTDVLELVHDSWMQAGVKLYSKPSQREMFRNRVFAGQSVMTIWTGLENGLPSADMSPEELAPTTQQQLQWPKWGQFIETGGKSGEKVDMPAALELEKLNSAWAAAPDAAARAAIWHQILRINAEQVFTIGLITGVKQPVVVNNRLRNVPVEGIFNWDPGSFFGIYRPELFWYGEPKQAATAGN
jgi:peptide/nickel transport system substrate-binding protein